MAFSLFQLLLRAQVWYYLEVKIITTGENQPQREIGTFGAELPENGKGHLQRSVVIKNQTRNKSNEVDFKITFQPQKTENGVKHIIFVSDVTPKVGKKENKFRDLIFDGRSNQMVEIFNDVETGTHLLVSLSITEKEIEKENIENIKVTFKCRVERIKLKEKEVIDTYDLQTVGGNPVKRTLTQKVPVWVEGDFGEISTTGFKEIDASNKPVYLKAGEGVTYTPPITKKDRKNKDKQETKKKKIDSRIPSKYQKEEENENTSGIKGENTEEKQQEKVEPPPPQNASINWEKEEFSYEISLLEASNGTIKSLIKMEGVLFDQAQRKLKPLQKKEETKTFSNGEIASFFLQENDEEGFILNVQAYF
ncbi:MAG: hypothetical protein N2445_01715 [Acidobacteria bacterium]|nr:hypothetical protein [Acidobacteriota bacterium]